METAPAGLNAEMLRRVLREELARVAVGTTRQETPQPAGEDEELRGGMDNLLNTWEFEEQG